MCGPPKWCDAMSPRPQYLTPCSPVPQPRFVAKTLISFGAPYVRKDASSTEPSGSYATPAFLPFTKTTRSHQLRSASKRTDLPFQSAGTSTDFLYQQL